MSSDHSGGAVVTGAASGIGRAIATGLATDGFPVVIADLDEARGSAVASEIAAANGTAIFHRVDVTDRTSVRAAIDVCKRQFGSIKVMVNNAGFNKPEPFLEASEAIWHKIMDVNALGVMIGIQEAGKAMMPAASKARSSTRRRSPGAPAIPILHLIAPANLRSSPSPRPAPGRLRAMASPSTPSRRVSSIRRFGPSSTRTSWRWGPARHPAKP